MDLKKIEINEEFDDIIDFQTKLFQIIESNCEEEEEMAELIQQYLEDRIYFSQLLKTLVMMIKSRPLLLDNIFKFISTISDQIKQKFSKSEIIFYFSFNLSAIYHLISLDIISFTDIMRESIYTTMNFFIFFAPEIEKNDPIYYSNLLNNSYYLKIFRMSNNDDSIQSKRKSGMNHLKIARLIQLDDAESLQELVAQDNLQIDFKIPKSDFETCDFLNKLKCRITMIEYAAFLGSVNVFKFLLLQKASMNSFIADIASAGGNADIIHLLEQQHVTFNQSSLEAAIICHQNQLFEYLHSNHNIQFSLNQLMLSITYFNFFCFNSILSENSFPIEMKDRVDLLVHSCTNGNLEAFQFLSKFVNFDEFNLLPKKQDLFSLACISGNPELVKYLIDCKEIDKNVLNFNLENSLHKTCLCGHLDVVKVLVNSHLYSINQPTKMNETALHYAVNRGHINVVDFLVNECSSEVNINSVSKAWMTPLMAACDKGFFQIVVILTKCENIELNCKDLYGRTALHIAALNGYSQIVSHLIELKGIDLNPIDKNGSTPLHLAAQSNKVSSIKILVEKKGVDIKIKDNAIFFYDNFLNGVSIQLFECFILLFLL